MLVTTSNFDTGNASTTKEPVWVVQFSGIATYFTSGTFSGITSSYKKYLRDFILEPGRIDLWGCHTEFYSFDFEIVDDSSNTVLGLLNTNNMSGKAVTAKIGYQSLAITDFVSLPNCVIEKINIEENYGVYHFYCVHKYNFIKRPIFRGIGITELTEEIDRTEKDWDVTSTASFTPVAGANWGIYVRCGNEICGPVTAYTGGNQINLSADLNVRIIGAGERTTHEEDETIYEVMDLTIGSVADTILQILTTTSAGTNGDYDLGIAGWGMGLDVGEIDVNQIVNELGDYGKWADGGDFAQRSMFVDTGILIDDGLEWIENNILKWIPAYFCITENGKLGVRVWDVRGNTEGAITVVENEINGWPEIESLEGDVLTHLEYRTPNYVMRLGRQGNSITEYQCDESNTAYTERKRHLLDLDCDGSSLTQFQIDRILERFFGYWGNPVAKINMGTFLKHQILLPGDIVNITHSDMPLIRTGSKGWTTEACMVVGGRIHYSAGKITPVYELHNIFMTEGSDVQDVHVWSESGIDDTSLSKEADHAQNNLTANDAYLAQSTYDATNVMVEIEVTPPGNGAGQDDRYITLYIQVQNVVDTNIKEEEKRFYYDETSSTAVKREFYVLNPTDDAAFPMTANTYAQVRVHWTATSGGTDPTSVKLTKVKFWDFKATISSTTIE